jgi:hypothetical protein
MAWEQQRAEAVGGEEEAGDDLIFGWEKRGEVGAGLRWAICLGAAVLVHAGLFYLFRVGYPGTQVVVPAERSVVVLRDDQVAGRALLRQVEDRAISLGLMREMSVGGEERPGEVEVTFEPSFSGYQLELRPWPGSFLPEIADAGGLMIEPRRVVPKAADFGLPAPFGGEGTRVAEALGGLELVIPESLGELAEEVEFDVGELAGRAAELEEARVHLVIDEAGRVVASLVMRVSDLELAEEVTRAIDGLRFCPGEERVGEVIFRRVAAGASDR